MIPEDTKEILDAHFEEFHSLRREGKPEEAMQQLDEMLARARSSMEHSMNLLRRSIDTVDSFKARNDYRARYKFKNSGNPLTHISH